MGRSPCPSAKACIRLHRAFLLTTPSVGDACGLLLPVSHSADLHLGSRD